MPVYEYKCLGCGKVSEILQRITDPALTECRACGGSLTKLISNTSFVLKGGGWYKDGYGSSGGGASALSNEITIGSDKKPDSSEKKTTAAAGS